MVCPCFIQSIRRNWWTFLRVFFEFDVHCTHRYFAMQNHFTRKKRRGDSIHGRKLQLKITLIFGIWKLYLNPLQLKTCTTLQIIMKMTSHWIPWWLIYLKAFRQVTYLRNHFTLKHSTAVSLKTMSACMCHWKCKRLSF